MLDKNRLQFCEEVVSLELQMLPTCDLVEKMIDHVRTRQNGPLVENGCWQMMLEAAKRLSGGIIW